MSTKSCHPLEAKVETERIAATRRTVSTTRGGGCSFQPSVCSRRVAKGFPSSSRLLTSRWKCRLDETASTKGCFEREESERRSFDASKLENTPLFSLLNRSELRVLPSDLQLLNSDRALQGEATKLSLSRAVSNDDLFEISSLTRRATHERSLSLGKLICALES